ncbi:LL-diaminopimelate aminotransferase [Candidatus Margulisiibacteriota bacterium]
MFKTSKRLTKVPPYLFAEIDKKKAAAIKKGIDIISLGIGDPDQPTFNYIVEAMHKEIDNSKNHDYPPYIGTLEFRSAACNWYKKKFNVDISPHKEMIALIGSKEGIAHIFWGIVDQGDTVLVQSPCYPVYRMGTIMAGGEVIEIPSPPENNFVPDFESLPKKVLDKAVMVMINFPNNPTAATVGLDYFEKIVSLAKKHDFLVVHDLAYADIVFDGYKAPSILQVKGAKDCAIEFASLSKSYNMTGWRIGFAAGNETAVQALSQIKTNIDSGAFKAIQNAAIVALNSSDEKIIEQNKMYQERRDVVIEGLQSLGWNIPPPKATFYIWAPVPKGTTSIDFCSEMLDKCGIIIVPGNGYGEAGEGFFRIAITQSVDRIKEAMKRMKDSGIKFK